MFLVANRICSLGMSLHRPKFPTQSYHSLSNLGWSTPAIKFLLLIFHSPIDNLLIHPNFHLIALHHPKSLPIVRLIPLLQNLI